MVNYVYNASLSSFQIQINSVYQKEPLKLIEVKTKKSKKYLDHHVDFNPD